MEYLLLGQGRGIGNLQLLGTVLLLLHGERHGLAALFAAEKINADVAGEPVEPGGKARLKLVLRRPPPDLQKGLLGEIRRILPVAGHPQAEVIDRFFIGLQQLGKGILVAGLQAANQRHLLFHGLTSNL